MLYNSENFQTLPDKPREGGVWLQEVSQNPSSSLSNQSTSSIRFFKMPGFPHPGSLTICEINRELSAFFLSFFLLSFFLFMLERLILFVLDPCSHCWKVLRWASEGNIWQNSCEFLSFRESTFKIMLEILSFYVGCDWILQCIWEFDV